MNRRASTQRAEESWNLRCAGRTWPEIAREKGYGTANSARKAVTKWLQRNPPDELEIMRRATGAALMNTTRKLDGALDQALAAGKTRDAAELGKVVLDGLDKYAKLTGQHVVVPTEVNVNVSTAELITSTRAKLMAAIDAEVVELPDSERATA